MKYQDLVYAICDFSTVGPDGKYRYVNNPKIDDDKSIPELDVLGVDSTPRLVDLINLYERALKVMSVVTAPSPSAANFTEFSARFSNRTLQYRDIKSIAKFARTFACPYGTTITHADYFAINNDDEIENPTATSEVSMSDIFQSQFGPLLVRRLSNEATISKTTDICDDFRKTYRDLDNLKRFIIPVCENGATLDEINPKWASYDLIGVMYGTPFFPLFCTSTTTVYYTYYPSTNRTEQHTETENGAKFGSTYTESYDASGRRVNWFSITFSEKPLAYLNVERKNPNYHGWASQRCVLGNDLGGFVGYRIGCHYGADNTFAGWLYGIFPVPCSPTGGLGAAGVYFDIDLNAIYSYALGLYNNKHSEVSGKKRDYSFSVYGIWLDTGHWRRDATDIPSDWSFGKSDTTKGETQT